MRAGFVSLTCYSGFTSTDIVLAVIDEHWKTRFIAIELLQCVLPERVKSWYETCRNTGSSKSLVFNAYLTGTSQATCVRYNMSLICTFSAEVWWIIKHKWSCILCFGFKARQYLNEFGSSLYHSFSKVFTDYCLL